MSWRKENRVDALTHIWSEVLAEPQPNVEAIIRRRLEPLARRLNISLGRE